MSKEEAEMKIKAVAFTVAAERGWREAVDALRRAASAIESAQWQGPGNR